MSHIMWALAAVLALLAGPAPQAEPRQAFEVVSIKPKGQFRGPAQIGISFLPGGRVVGVNAPVYLIIQDAYGLSDKQIDFKGLPDRDFLGEAFDFEAKAGTGALPESAPAKDREHQLRLMLQSMLADRFNMQAHRETKEFPMYALLVAPGGSKLKPSPARKECPAGNRCGSLGGGPASGVQGFDVEMSELVATLIGFGDRHVIDRTGIKGKFDIALPPWNRSLPVSKDPLEPSEDPNGPSISAVLQRTLGLRLESIKGPLEILVVDKITRPRPN